MPTLRQRTQNNHTKKEFRQLQQQSNSKQQEVIGERGTPYATNETEMPYIPSAFTAWKALFIVRLTAAFWSVISDCDETYNYWEPMHYLIYNKGFQTWEYDAKYGLRSYLYILVHTLPAWIFAHVLQPNPMFVFFSVRCILAAVCSACETYFYIGVTKEIGANVGRITLGILLFSAGMFISSTAFLPSTTSMYLCMLAHGAWFQQTYALAIFFTALSTFLSWPFAALLGLPIAADILLRRKRFTLFIQWSIISTITILIPQILMDSQYYGKLTIAPLNIVTYNVLSDHGPDLYGTEPWTYYLFNGILNFNVAFILAILVWPLQGLLHLVVDLPQRSAQFLPVTMSQLALYLWFFVFWSQPHKEERFLFPIYPLICLAAAVSVDTLQKLFYAFCVRVQNRYYLEHSSWISVSFLVLTALVSVSRIVALYQNYHASMDLWMHANSIGQSEKYFTLGKKMNVLDISTYFHLTIFFFSFSEEKVSVCMGKEWYRFPSHFFLPENWQVKFVKSEFKGQLPQMYAANTEDATKLERGNFNDMNKEETDRYVKVSLE